MWLLYFPWVSLPESLFNSLRDSDDTVKRLPTSLVINRVLERQADHGSFCCSHPSGHYALDLYNCDSLQEAELKALAQCDPEG